MARGPLARRSAAGHVLAALAAVGGALLLAAALPMPPGLAAARAGTGHPGGAHPIAAPPPPVATGRLRIAGTLRDGGAAFARGLRWRPGRLPPGDRLLSFEVAYLWSSCSPADRCRPGADSTVTPFAATGYLVGHADVARLLRLTETATEVVQTTAAENNQPEASSSRSVTSTAVVAAFPSGTAPRTEFVDGLPESPTGSNEEYFAVDPPHYNGADGVPVLRYRVDAGPWRALPSGRVFETGPLQLGRHRVEVRTTNAAGMTRLSFSWRVVPLPAPAACVPRRGGSCWYPPHLDASGRPMRWDWQIGASTPVERTGAAAVDIYDVDGFLTTAAQVHRIHTSWPAASLEHPKLVCYLDAAWENYRPDASPVGYGGRFPPDTLGKVYPGYPNERWVDFRQVHALAPMLEERVGMCARKGFDAVELDDIDVFDPASTTGFHLTPGDVQNYLAVAFNLIHRAGLTALWKNTPLLSWWGRQYTDGAIVEQCYQYRQCYAAQYVGTRQYGLRCTALAGPTPCGWDDFTTDTTRQQPSGKWVGEAEYVQAHVVCRPGVACSGRHRRSFRMFCQAVYAPAFGYSAVLYSVDLNATVFDPCPRGR